LMALEAYLNVVPVGPQPAETPTPTEPEEEKPT